MKKQIHLYVAFFLFLLIPFGSVSQITWPNGAKAAICLTYDDGLDCHLDVAVHSYMNLV